MGHDADVRQQHDGPRAPTPGAIDGGAAELIDQLWRANLPGREKDLVLWLISQTYGADAQARYCAGDPDWYWIPISLKELSATFDDRPPNMSTRISRLGEAGVLLLDKAPSGWNRRFALRRRWPPALFDRQRARELHARAGAGSTPDERAAAPEMPLAERPTDRRGTAMMRAEHVDADLWPFVEHFQRVADEAFQDEWLPFLEEARAYFSVEQLMRRLTNVMGYYAMHDRRSLRYPFGAFKRDVLDAIAKTATTRAEFTRAAGAAGEEGRQRHDRIAATTARAADAVSSDAGATGRGAGGTTNADRLARGEARARQLAQRGRDLAAAAQARHEEHGDDPTR